MKKIITSFLSFIMCLTLMCAPNNVAEASSATSIEDNSIQLLAYEYPINLKTKIVEFKFEDQGDNTAKLKTYIDGKSVKPNEIQSNLALYNDLGFFLTNIYGYESKDYLDRGTSMRSIASYFESLTFTYGVDTVQFARVPIVFDHCTEGIFTFGYGGEIKGNLNNRDFNDALMFYQNSQEWRFRVREDGLYAEFLGQNILEDGEYYIETVDSSNRVLDALSGDNAGVNDYNPSSKTQKVILEFDEKNYATTIKFGGTNKYLRWDKNNGNNVIVSDKMTSGDIGEQYWYLVEAGDGTYNIISARQTTKFLNLDANDSNISINNDRSNTKQKFRIVKASERKSIVNSNFKIVSKMNNNKVLNIDIGGSDSRNLNLWDDAGVTQQRFYFEYDANKNAYRIRDAYHNGYLAWNNNGVDKNVSTYQGWSTDSGYWTLEYAGDGYYYIKNLYNPNMVLDVTNKKTANATNIGVYKKNGGNNQKFKFVF